MVYKNISSTTKQFYGVMFQPGEIKEVPGYVNDKHMIVSKLPIAETKPVVTKPAEAKPAKQSNKKPHVDRPINVEETESQIIKEEEQNG